METNYDIFISFKNSDKDGKKTKDRELAYQLYKFLKSKNLKIFFSESTLQELGSGAWQKDIKEALKVSKIFIAIGTKNEYFESKWVQWERTTFLTRKEDDISKAIYSYIAPPMSISQLPKDIEYFECFEDTKPNEFERLYSFISNHLFRYFHRIKDNEYIDENTANPYKGLNSFGYDDQANYYGREVEAKEIAKTLKTTRLLTLLGASGSGKSSLIYAGVIPFIEEDGVEILTFRPLDNPLKSLASLFIPLLYEDKLERLRKEKELANDLLKNSITITQLVEQFLEKKRAKHLYLVIDQFEELFTLTDDKEHRGAFLAKVLELITGTLPVTLLISMRADFLTYLSYSDSLNEVYNNHPNKMLAILKKEKLRAVIEKPALALGVTFADGLVEKIIEEIEQEAGQLPLLEFALEQLWRHKKGRVISFNTLEQIGSITQSISHYADSVYERYRDRENSIKRIFLNLVRVGSQNTKKVTKIDEFSPDDRETITLLANERLIVTNKDEIEIVHEALIREWKQLKEWVDEYQEFLVWQERVREDRWFYEENGEKKEDLLRDSKLLVAKDFLGSHGEYVSDGDVKFIKQSIKREKQVRFRKGMIFSSVFLAIFGLAFYGFWQKNQSEKLNDKLIIIVNRFFKNKQDNSFASEINNLEIYLSIVDEFRLSKEKQSIELLTNSYYKIGQLCIKKKKFDEAILYFEKAIKINSKYYWSYVGMGNAYNYKKKYNQAINYYQKAIDINSKECWAYQGMGNAYRYKKKYTRAINYYQKAIEINHKFYWAYLYIGDVYSYKKEHLKTINYYQKSFQLQLVQNKPFDQKAEKYIKLFQNKKESFIYYEMLKILQDITHNKKINLEQWKQKYHGVEMGWDFDILDEWIDGFDEGEVKERLRKAIGVFKGHG